MVGRIVQLGTSRFLQAHVDLFVHEAREEGQAVGPITVVQVSGSPERAGRVAAFGRPEGFPVVIRGLEAGRPVERTVTVRSVDRGLAAERDWEELADLVATRAEAVVSNTGDAGYAVAARDRTPDLLEGGAAPASFPGKLLALLWRRWRKGGRPLALFPCELISGNGGVLRDTVLALARDAQAPADFAAWLGRDLVWADTLVDRIVSSPIEPVGAVAEPYALWAIARRPGLAEPPCRHPAIVMADDLEPYERLKLHILNLGHTVLADLWMSEARDPGDTVRAMLADPAVRERLETVYRRGGGTGLAPRGPGGGGAPPLAATPGGGPNPLPAPPPAPNAPNPANQGGA